MSDTKSRDERDADVRRDTDVVIRRVGWFVAKLLFFVIVFLPMFFGALVALLPGAFKGAGHLFGNG